MLAVSKPGALNCHVFSRPIPLTLSASSNPNLTHLPLSGSLDSLPCDLIAPTPDLVFSHDATHSSRDVIIFVKKGLSFSELSTSSLYSFDPYSDYVRINISLDNSSSITFLNVYAHLTPSSATDGRTDSFLPPPKISSYWRTSTAINPCGTQKALPTLVWRKYLTGLFLLASSPSTNLAYPLSYIVPLAVAPPLTFPLLPPLSPFLANGRCFRTWVRITYQFFYVSLSLRTLAPTSAPFLQFSGSSLG